MLRVIEAFAGHAIGDTIADVEREAEVLAGELAAFVVRVIDQAEGDVPAQPVAADAPAATTE